MRKNCFCILFLCALSILFYQCGQDSGSHQHLHQLCAYLKSIKPVNNLVPAAMPPVSPAAG